jgi:hypothetical protein
MNFGCFGKNGVEVHFNKKNPLTMISKSSLGFLIFIAVVLVFSGACNQAENQSPATSQVNTSTDGTAKMVALLQEANAKIDPMKVQFYANAQRAEQFKAMMESASDPGQKLKAYIQYAYELLSAGKNEQSIGEFEKLLPLAVKLGMKPEGIYQIKKLLAIAYIRLGEAENCIERNNEESCIMPLKNKGIYTITEASRSAIRLYEEMLAENPEDYESIWMLNLAYMTLGEYPQKVPAKWRIPESSFASDAPMAVFPNISKKIGVGTVALSGGACVDDFNNDGLLDIVASSWGVKDQLRLYINDGNGKFTEKTNEAGLTGLTGGLNAVHTDYNNDGFVDVLVLRGAWFDSQGKIPNSLIRNNGDGTFTDVTVEAGLLSYAPTQAAAWADFNNDGWLDLFIGNESLNGNNFPCEFYFNNGDGTFTNRINELGLGQFFAYVKGCAAGDYNNDGWIDLYISTLNSENFLLQNMGLTNQAQGLIAFQNVTPQAKVSLPIYGFPAWFFDFNNDGWEDIFAASYGLLEGSPASALAALNHLGKYTGANPHLYLNNGNGTFKDISSEAGLREDLFIMGSNFGDIDNDGWIDIYLGTGAPGFTSVVPNKMFRNNQGKTLQDVTTAGGFGHNQKGHGIGFSDFDNDGDQDIFAVMGGALEGDVYSDAFFLNPVGNLKSWVTLKLEGTTANKAAIGARVKVVTVNSNGRERAIYNTVSTGSSFGGNSLQLEIGLDDAVKIKFCEIRWPNRQGTIQVFENLEINKSYKLVEGRNAPEVLNLKTFAF